MKVPALNQHNGQACVDIALYGGCLCDAGACCCRSLPEAPVIGGMEQAVDGGALASNHHALTANLGNWMQEFAIASSHGASSPDLLQSADLDLFLDDGGLQMV